MKIRVVIPAVLVLIVSFLLLPITYTQQYAWACPTPPGSQAGAIHSCPNLTIESGSNSGLIEYHHGSLLGSLNGHGMPHLISPARNLLISLGIALCIALIIFKYGDTETHTTNTKTITKNKNKV